MILVLLAFSTLAVAIGEYSLNCRPKPGCDFSQCDPIPQVFLELEGFDPDEYRRRNDYHITCQPDVDRENWLDMEGLGHKEKMDKMEKTIISLNNTVDENSRMIRALSAENKLNEVTMQKLEENLNRSETEREQLKQVIKALTSRLEALESINKPVVPVTDIASTTTSPENCLSLAWQQKCFWIEIKDSTSYERGQKQCEEKGGHPANIYSENHYRALVAYTGKTLKWNRVARLWLGMRVDPKDEDQVLLSTGERAPFIEWTRVSYRNKKPSFSQVGLYWSPSDTLIGMYNYNPKTWLQGVICEKSTAV